jgi:hypothetical protein
MQSENSRLRKLHEGCGSLGTPGNNHGFHEGGSGGQAVTQFRTLFFDVPGLSAVEAQDRARFAAKL